jgi:hypothetical protein
MLLDAAEANVLPSLIKSKREEKLKGETSVAVKALMVREFLVFHDMKI